MREWETKTIDQLPIDLIDGDRSSRYPKRSSYVNASDILFLNAESINSGKLDLSNVNYLSEATYSSVTKGRLRKGDLVLTMRGNGVGKVAYYGHNLRGLINAQMLIIRPDPSYINSQYLYYYFSNPVFQRELQGFVSGSAQPQLTITHLKRVSLTLPPLIEQQSIVELLGSLDDKIELNRRMNATLEATARALFKSWFVDFDPVHYKARGEQPPSMDAETAALFPDSFEDSELGLIPAGWAIGSMLNQSKLLSGGTPKTDRPEYWDGSISWASAKDVSQAGETFLISTERSISSKGLQESATQLIPASSTVIVARGATTGRMVLFGYEMAMNQTCYALVSTTNTPFSLFCHLKNEIAALVFAGHGSVFNTITTNTFANSRVIIPPTPILEIFERQISPVFLKILNSSKESTTLAHLRDGLLPKLVSGELRVGE
jgi:type I restriction enzyme, S subunit